MWQQSCKTANWIFLLLTAMEVTNGWGMPDIELSQLRGCLSQVPGDYNQATVLPCGRKCPPPPKCVCPSPPPGYAPVAGFGYMRVSAKPATWVDAVAECAAEGAMLPVPATESLAQALAYFINFNAPGRTSPDWAWLGANDIEEEGKWVTADGLPVSSHTSNLFYPGEPNSKRVENCMVFNKATGKMGDAPCTWISSFACIIPF